MMRRDAPDSGWKRCTKCGKSFDATIHIDHSDTMCWGCMSERNDSLNMKNGEVVRDVE